MTITAVFGHAKLGEAEILRNPLALADLIGRKVGAGDLGAVANTVLLMGREKVGTRVGRFVCVAKHRGSAMSDDIAGEVIPWASLGLDDVFRVEGDDKILKPAVLAQLR